MMCSKVTRSERALIIKSNRPKEVIQMQNEKKKKGFLSMIWESMTKTGGCCGSGESCGCSPQPDDSKKKTDSKKEEHNERS